MFNRRTDRQIDTSHLMILMAPIVREATESDVEQLAPLFIQSVDTSLPGITFSSDPRYALDVVQPQLLKRLFPPKSRKTFVLESHTGELLGYGNVKPDGGPNKDEDELDHLFVKTGEDRKGYGSQLMEAIQEEFGERGLWVQVFERNERAVRFYEKWGFSLGAGGRQSLKFDLGEGPQEETVCCMRWSRTSQS
uniref:6-methylsalicylic acid synthase (6-MSAS) ) n=1 Tax=Ganoderma boninense TaxID=34458 RepID=A0A5K1JTR6_9APHY|nr:6-methylsalicylic acid synthase (6-MSAS) (EC (Arthrosporol biosynthesis cluster protein AOL_s00215g283) [Ganoderma boninense]